ADAAVAAVVADPVHRDVVDHGGVVGVVDVGDVDVVDAAVVPEVAVAPFAAVVAVAGVAVAVVDAAIEADVRAPVAGVPEVDAVAPAPPARRPQIARLGRQHPGAGHPVVVAGIVVPGPVARRPDIAFGRR